MAAVATVHVDLANQRLWCGEQEIKLTPKAFALLRYFVERPEQLISKDDLLDVLWQGRYVSEELIRDYVRDLRKALGDDSGSPRYIETLRRRGYRYLGGITVGERSLAPTPHSVAVEANRALAPLVKPALAVLPFANFSGDPAQDYLADGITESLITTLSKIPKLFVIARTSSFYYKGKVVTVKQVAEELGVRYVLEGSVQRFGDKMRVTVQLIDALSGHHLWAEGYDRALTDLFELQDEIVWQVATELEVQLTQGEMARVWRRATHHAGAYQHFRCGFDQFQSIDPLTIEQIQRWLTQALALDRKFASAWSLLAEAYCVQARFCEVPNRAELLSRAADCAQQALALDDTCADAHNALGDIYQQQGKHDEGLALLGKAVALDPNNAYSMISIANSLVYYSGRFQEALIRVEQALHLNPHPPAWYLSLGGCAQLMLGYPDRAIAAFEQVLQSEPHGKPMTRCWLAATYANTGQIAKARAVVAGLLKMAPYWSVSQYLRACPIIDPAHCDSIMRGLRKAGLPE
ncbi:MAG: winged helix-turn-helix domain-containing protein [Gammaproteobacteria bacterium]